MTSPTFTGDHIVGAILFEVHPHTRTPVYA